MSGFGSYLPGPERRERGRNWPLRGGKASVPLGASVADLGIAENAGRKRDLEIK